jgi:ubiquinone/menaquinone biosynthesis C-methylase UbiE
MNERDFVIGYTTHGIGIDVGCGDNPFIADNIRTIDINHPKAEMPNMPFEEMGLGKGQTVDFIIFSHSLREMESITHALKHAFELLALGGRIIILEKQDVNARQNFNFAEMQGMFRLMDKVYYVECKGQLENGTYYIVARKKGEDK